MLIDHISNLKVFFLTFCAFQLVNKLKSQKVDKERPDRPSPKVLVPDLAVWGIVRVSMARVGQI